MRTRAIARATGVVVLVFALVWLAVVLAWRARGVTPGGAELFGYLLVLPLVLLGGIWLVRRARARGGATAPAASDAAAVGTEAATGATDRALTLLGAALWMRAGDSPAAVCAALADPARPPLHPRLRDRLGLPVFAAPVEAVDGEAVADMVAATTADGDAFRRIATPEQLRALALLDPVAEALLAQALPEPAGTGGDAPLTAGGMHPFAMHHSRSSRADAPAPARAPTQVRLLLPAAWPAQVRTAAADWVRAKAVALGHAAGAVELEVTPVAAAIDAWRLLEHLALATPAAGDGPQLLLAADSLLGEASIDRLDSRRELLVSGHPEGLVPGEGAAGLLFGVPDPAAEAVAVTVHGMRQAPAGQGRGAGAEAGRLLRDSLALARTEADHIAALFTDADQRPSRSIEVAGAVTAALPALDALADVRSLGVVCGATGAVAPLALLAAAADAARAAPVLVLGTGDASLRVAMTLSPLAVPNDQAAAAESAADAGSPATTAPVAA